MQNPYTQHSQRATALPEGLAGVDLPHYIEWLDSCVEPDFISANVRSLSGEEAFSAIAGIAHEKAAEGAKQTANSKLRFVNSANRHLYAGGWWCSGVDPLKSWEPMEWGQLKPNTPKFDERKGRDRKYEAPAATGTRLFYANVPPSIARKVIERHNFSAQPENQISKEALADLEIQLLWKPAAFWPWLVEHPQIQVLLTEGSKKVGAAFSAGFVAVGLPGIWNGRNPWLKDAEGKRIEGQKAALRTELLAIAQPGRKIVFAFDNDEALKTQLKVWKAVEATAFLFLKDTKAQPYFTSWDWESGKGIDDYIAANGADEFAKVVAAAQCYENWKIEQQLARALTRTADLKICLESLKGFDFSQLPDTGIIGIASAKGSGKTQHFLKPLVADEHSLLLVGHLINLTKANSARMACTYRTDLDRAAGRFIDASGEVVYRVSTVIDSLLSFSPKDFEGSVIVLDEICQLLRSALTSKNIGKRGNRGAILTRLRQIIQKARLVVVADADLNDWALEYLEALRGDDKPAFLIKNTYVPEGYPVTLFEASGADGIVAEALDTYESEVAKGASGQHVAIATDSQTKAKVLAKQARELPGAVVLELHSETSGGEIEKLFIENPDQYLSYQDSPALIIYSPSLGTGVSIESQEIAHVFGIFEGKSITDTDILQMLGRVRKPCPRSVWVRAKGSAYSALSHSAVPEKLKEALKLQADATAASIRHSLSETAYSGLTSFQWDTDPHIEAYCQIEADRNRCMPNLRARVAYRLEKEGNRIGIRNQWESAPTKLALKATRIAIAEEEANAVEASEDIGATTAALLAAKEAPSIAERNQLKKYHLADFYLEAVTSELVLKDGKGKRRSEVRAFEEFQNLELATERDTKVIEKQMSWGELTPQDIRSSALAAKVRKTIGLDKWLERTDSWQSGCADLQKFKRVCSHPKNVQAIKAALGYTVKADASGQQILGDLLSQLGVKVESKRKRIRGKAIREYSIESENLSTLCDLVSRREDARNAEAEGVTAAKTSPKSDPPPLCLNKKTEGVDHPENSKSSIELEANPPVVDEGGGAARQFALAGMPESLKDDFYDASAWS